MAKGDLIGQARDTVARIKASGLSIYDPLQDRPDLYLATPALQAWLGQRLDGLNLNYPLRTRSKVLKQAVAKELGYPVPEQFQKCRPRFLGQNFDTYVQKANNLQIWNEEVSPERRYVVVSVAGDHNVNGLRVVTGTDLAVLDTTGTLTSKYQAKIKAMPAADLLGSSSDTDHFMRILAGKLPVGGNKVGVRELDRAKLLPIGDVFTRLQRLVGQTFRNPGLDQERNRGALLHDLVQKSLGAAGYADTGQFPDVPDQLLEIKLQTSPTVDLGLVSPDSVEQISDIPQARHCDVRYAVLFASIDKEHVRLNRLVLTTGADFFRHFTKFGGLTVNKKRQLHLPGDFFHNT